MPRSVGNSYVIGHVLNVFIYFTMSFVTIRVVGAIFIFVHNAQHDQQLLYLQTLFGNNPPLTFSSFLSSLVLAPVLETIILSLFFLKILFSPKFNMFVFAVLFSTYHFLSMGVYGAIYTFFVGFLFACQYYFNLKKYGKNTALNIAVITHILLNLASFYA